MLNKTNFFSSVPNDVIKLIFPYLGPQNNSEALIAFMKTCKRMHELITTDKNLQFYASPIFYRINLINLSKKIIRTELLKQIEIEKNELTTIRDDLLEKRKKLIDFQQGFFYDDLLSLRKDLLSMPDSSFFRLSSYIKNNKIKYVLLTIFVFLLLNATFIIILKILNNLSNVDDKIESEYNAYINSPTYAVNDTGGRHVYDYWEGREGGSHYGPELVWEHHPSKCDGWNINSTCILSSTYYYPFYICPTSTINQTENNRNECINHYEMWQALLDQKNTLLSLGKGTSALPSAVGLILLIEVLATLYFRNRINSKKYLDLPISYLSKEHAKRFEKIKNKYSKEIQREKISTIADIAELLSKIYYQTPPSPNNLLVECEEHIENIDSILNAEEIAFVLQ